MSKLTKLLLELTLILNCVLAGADGRVVIIQLAHYFPASTHLRPTSLQTTIKHVT